MTQPAATVTNTMSTIGPAPEALEAETTEETSPAEPAATSSDPAAPPAGKEERAPAPPAETAKIEDDPHQVSRRFDGLARSEARSRRVDVELQQRASTLKEREDKIAAREAELEAALEDPVKYYLDRGKDPVEVATRFSKPETEEQKEIRLLKEREAAREKREKEERETAERQAAEQRRVDNLRKFVGSIEPKDCPTLTTEFEPHEVPGLIQEVLHRTAQPAAPEDRKAFDLFVEEHGRRPTAQELFQVRHRRNPSDVELREVLELEAVTRATRREERRRRYTAAAPAQPPETDPEPPQQVGPKSISNQHGATTSTAKPKPMTLEEKRRAKRAEIVADLEGDGGT